MTIIVKGPVSPARRGKVIDFPNHLLRESRGKLPRRMRSMQPIHHIAALRLILKLRGNQGEVLDRRSQGLIAGRIFDKVYPAVLREQIETEVAQMEPGCRWLLSCLNETIPDKYYLALTALLGGIPAELGKVILPSAYAEGPTLAEKDRAQSTIHAAIRYLLWSYDTFQVDNIKLKGDLQQSNATVDINKLDSLPGFLVGLLVALNFNQQECVQVAAWLGVLRLVEPTVTGCRLLP